MIKAAFFDIDGTLLSHRTNTVPESAKMALRALREKGVLVFLATGRQLPVLKLLTPLQGIVTDGSITLNGQYCCNEKGLIYAQPIHREDIARLLAHLEKTPLACGFVEEKELYVNFHNQVVERVHAAIHTPMPPLGDLKRGYDRDIYQVIVYGSQADIDGLPLLPHTKMTRWNDGGVDMLPATGGKAVGIEKVLEYYGIAKEETIAFGDGENDIDMLRAVGIGVAMGNAGDSVKAESDYVTDSVDDDGILHALQHFHIL